MKARFPNGVEAEGSPRDLAEFVASLTQRLKNAPPALPEPSADPPVDPDSISTRPESGSKPAESGALEKQHAEEAGTPSASTTARPRPDLPDGPTNRETRGPIPAEWRVETPGVAGPTGDVITCELCDDKREFTSRGLVSHKLRVHGVPMKHVCPTCQQEFDSGSGLGGHKKKHRNEVATQVETVPEKEYKPEQSPEPTSQPVAKVRLTDKICADAVTATFDGKTIAAWAETVRFRGNMNALIPWVNMVVRATNRMAWRAMPEADKERFVLRAIGGRINESALSGGS